MKLLATCVLLAAILGLGCSGEAGSELLASGIVRDESGPVADAIVRMRATPWFTMTDADGRFTLEGVAPPHPFSVTASATGYYIGGGDQELLPGSRGIEITLVRHYTEDEANYVWLSATTSPGAGEAQACATCHSSQDEAVDAALPADEWLQDAHSGSAQNQRFLSMYAGTDLAGNQSPPTRFGTSRDYGRFPLPPDETQPYFGPGYRLDFSESAGNCATCHVPVAAANDPFGVDPLTVSGVGLEGVTCDFCHKIHDIRLDPDTLLANPSLPGVLSYVLLRPPEGHQYFAGPFDDVAPGEDVYSPLQRKSQFCAGCHSGTFWDVPIYDSYGEWLASPYSDPDTGRTCQSCHMPSSGSSVFALMAVGGQDRDPLTIASHRMPGASDVDLLQNSVSMSVDASRDDGRVEVTVTILNDQTGHHVPTDSPLRQLILLVRATDQAGRSLQQIDGTVVPEWGGVGDPEAGYYAGLPGTAYAKVLQEVWTEVTPTGAYWNQTRVVSDNRIAALDSASSSYTFAAPSGESVDVDVVLLFRRAYIELADQKGWTDEDIVMEHETTVLAAQGSLGIDSPLLVVGLLAVVAVILAAYRWRSGIGNLFRRR